MNILYITQAGFGLPSAETTHAMEIIKSFIKMGHNVTVAFSGSDVNIRGINVDLICHPRTGLLPWRLGFQVWLLRRFVLGVKHHNFDLIYVRQSALMFAPVLIKLVSRARLITEFNTMFSHAGVVKKNFLNYFVVKLVENLTIMASDRVVVVSSKLLQTLSSRYGSITRKSKVIGNGCNLDFMRPQNKNKARIKFGIPLDAFVVGFVGHLHPWQGINVITDAVCELKKTKTNVVAVIVGSSDDINNYTEYAKLKGVGDSVMFVGALSYNDVPVIMSCFDIGLAPGIKESNDNYLMRSPIKVYEYLANAKPVISGALPSLYGIFKNHNIGYLIDPGNVEELVLRIRELMENQALMSQMGAEARIVAEKYLSWDSAAIEILN